MEETITIQLPNGWKPPESTLEPLLKMDDPQWFTILRYVCGELREAGNDDSVLHDYCEQAMADDFRHLVRCSMVFMGEMELEHDSPKFV